MKSINPNKALLVPYLSNNIPPTKGITILGKDLNENNKFI